MGADDAEFDHGFILKSNDPEQVQRLFASAQLREAARPALSAGRFELKLGGQLYFEQAGIITDVQRLMNLDKLFEETLNQLQKIGPASALTR